jgi:hypothetical protein
VRRSVAATVLAGLLLPGAAAAETVRVEAETIDTTDGNGWAEKWIRY